MALGYFAGWSRQIDGHHATSLNTLVVQFALPAAIFVPTASTAWSTLVAQWRFLLVLTLVMLALYAVAYGMQRHLFGLGASEASVQALTIAQPNYAAVGLPLMTAVFDPSYAVYAALALTLGSFLASLTLVVLEAHRTDAAVHKTAVVMFTALGRSLLKPIIVSPLIAFVFSYFAVHLPTFIVRSFALIGQVAAGGALFVTGLVLSTQCPSFNANVISGALLKNVLQPLLAAGLLLLLPVSHDVRRAAILLTALPAGFIGVLFGVRYGVESSHSAGSTLLVSSLLSAVTLAVTILATTAH
jgi:malonate transporter